ncbi:sigma 54-interacting transcriptional regulator [Candidatus Aminicenantes bacterium AC-708-M15]|jgi:DNA-binding NtrC family response regulator|nr:sigma 54-interacting transcriptional regulator [SCandidatus Aminicenantes bacterium Aminicenantia_JdfR_composite]MCP2597106.1 sigma 54-interacting transcriptional regulator [Candidatus Aminicenantes bacterium AC-335-G13]MCP2598231.1 sigma 54-interacting transcriptional regulator [Candidatus Aminicenantes bacterium AC-335-L06]MCP2598864.1 sigma 54-interacting transcriptional regulator [Candidatus Aminicenantes bacterium AC-335-B20]MCP2604356.1 sigma 54-interacting transcriptional regulator [C
MILLIGKSGAGKEVISRLIHYLSKRKESNFHAINCSSFNDEMLYCELFGHEKGAYTGADRRKEGILKTSDGGTVFLDEIQASSWKFQHSLLRFLDYGEIRPLGSDRTERADVRIIAASNEEPKKLLKEGKFIEPFYHRITGLQLYIPLLRERRDLENYIYYFLFKESDGEEIKISESALEALKRYLWPGNFREMKRVIRALIIKSKSGIVKFEALPAKIKNPEMCLPLIEGFHSISSENSLLESSLFHKSDELNLDNIIRTHIQKVLRLTRGNKTKASKLLGIPLTTLISKMKKLRIK